MEFINNRYQVLSVLEGGPFGPMFRVRDSLRHDHRLLLQLPGTGNDLSGLFSRLEDDFIRISQLSHPALARYRHFGRVVKVDGMPAHSGRFFLTCDDVPLDLPFREAVRQVGPRAAAVLVCRLAAAMRYLHDRGFIMGALNERTLRFFRVDGKWEVRPVGLPLPAQSRPGSRDHRQDSETVNLPEHVDNGDMEALGELLLRLAAGFPAPRRGVAAMHAEAENRWDRLPADAPERLVLALVERMLGLHGDEDRPEPDAVIRALNSAFGLQEPLFDVASNQRILHHVPLQDRTGRMASMIAEGIRRLSGARGLFTQGICGDRGAGKTRNCEELQFRCEMRGFPVYRTELAEGGDVDPFPSLVRVLLPDASAETIHQYGPELVKLLPDNPLLRACRANPPLPADQEEKRMRTRVLGFVEAVVKEHPAVLVFDDLNRFPQERLMWIDSLLERLRRHSAWVVFAWDGIELAGKARELLNRWEERFGLSPEWLPPFGPEDTARFITMSLGLPRDAMAFSRHVHEETDGNPARIRGLLYTLRHDGLLHLDENGHWSTRFDGLRDYSHLKPDSTYEKALEEAYARLEPTAWRLLQHIALMKGQIGLPLLETVTGIGQEDLVRELGLLADQQLVLQQCHDSGYLYGLRHPHQRKILLQGLSTAQRQEMHARIARALGELGDEPGLSELEERIHQTEEAGLHEEAIRLAALASQRSFRIGIPAQGIRHLQEGLRIARQNSLRDGETDLLIHMARLHNAVSGYTEARRCMDAALALLAPDNADPRLPEMLYLAFLFCFRADAYIDAQTYLNRLEAAVRVQGGAPSACRLALARSIMALHRMAYDEAARLAEEAISHLTPEAEPLLCARTYEQASMVQSALSHTDEALRHLWEAFHAFEREGSPLHMAAAYIDIGMIYQTNLEQPARARQYLFKALDIARQGQAMVQVAFCLNNLGDTYLMEEDFHGALPFLEEGASLSDELGNLRSRFYLGTNLVEAWTSLGDFKAATHERTVLRTLLEARETPPMLAVYAGVCDIHYQWAVGGTAQVVGTARDVIRQMGLIENSDRVDAEIHLALAVSVLDAAWDAGSLSAFEPRIDALESGLHRRRLYLLLAGAAMRQGDKPAAKRWLDMSDQACSSPAAPATSLRTAFLRAQMLPDASRIRAQEELLVKADADEPLTRYQILADLCATLASNGRSEQAMERGIEALSAVRVQMTRVPEAEGRNFWRHVGAQALMERLEHLISTSFDLSKWTTEVERSHQESISARVLLALGEAGLELRKAIVPLLDFLGADWGVLMRRIGTEHREVLAESGDISCAPDPEMLRTLGERGEAVLMQRDELRHDMGDAWPPGLSAVLVLPFVPVRGKATSMNRANRRKAGTGGTDTLLLIAATRRVFHQFQPAGMTTLARFGPLLGMLQENHVLRRVSNVDRLTGLMTRKFMEESLSALLSDAEANGEPLCLLMMDIDRFKRVNDQYGHQKGDEILARVSAIIRGNCRGQDVCCRYGGEEMLVMMPATGARNGKLVAERIRSAVEAASLLDRESLTISIGVAVYPRHGVWKDELVEHADQAMYHAKQTGRNRVCLWQSGLARGSRQRPQIEGSGLYRMTRDERAAHAFNAAFGLLTQAMSEEERIRGMLDQMANVLVFEQAFYLPKEALHKADWQGAVTLGRLDSVEPADGPQGETQFGVETGGRDPVWRRLAQATWKACAPRTAVDWGRTPGGAEGIHEVSLMAVPVMRRKVPEGVLFLATALQRHEYGPQDQMLTLLFADMLGLGLGP